MRSSGVKNSLFDRSWQWCEDKAIGRIEIVFARFIDDPDHGIFFSVGIVNDLVQLTNLE